MSVNKTAQPDALITLYEQLKLGGVSACEVMTSACTQETSLFPSSSEADMPKNNKPVGVDLPSAGIFTQG